MGTKHQYRHVNANHRGKEFQMWLRECWNGSSFKSGLVLDEARFGVKSPWKTCWNTDLGTQAAVPARKIHLEIRNKRIKKMTKQFLFPFAIWSYLIHQNTLFTTTQPPLQIQFYRVLPPLEIPATPRNNYCSATSGESYRDSINHD